MKLAICTRNPKFSGTCFDSFEYFYRLWELDKSTKYIMLFPSLDRDFILRKYNINKQCLNNIIVDDCYKYYIENVLFFDTHCFKTEKLNSKNIYVVANSEITYKPIEICGIPQNIKIYSEFFHNRNYIHKLYFNIQKIFKHKRQTYINAMDIDSLKIWQIINSYKPFILKNPMSAFQSYNNTNFRPDFFREFDKYVYIKTPKTFDRHPRMFSECVNQGIDCEYVNLSQDLDPSWFRFQDRLDIEKRDIRVDNLIEDILSGF